MNKGDLTRRRIIAQAAPLFNARGFEGCSMHDVMEATGLEKGGLYRHFADKEELAVEVFHYSLDQAIKTRTDGLDHIPGARAKLEYIIRRFVDLPSPVPGGCPLLNTAVDADDGNPILRNAAREAFAGWQQRLSRIVGKGIRNGEFRSDANPRQLATSIIATLEGALVLSRIEGTRRPLQHAQASLLLLLRMFAAHPPSAQRPPRRSSPKRSIPSAR
jgi:TetR/AcrR family transcriptional regulator, transcriptional repressor for nem operon